MNIPIVVSCVLAGLAVLMLISSYNGIVDRANASTRAWSSVVVYERQKNEVIPRLETLVGQSKEFESALQSRIVQLRSAVGGLSASEIDPAALEKAQQASHDFMRAASVTVEAYPRLETIGLMKELMKQIAQQQENVAAAITIFNSTVEEHHDSIQEFPASLVNALFAHRKPIVAFSDAQAAAGFAYRPNL